MKPFIEIMTGVIAGAILVAPLLGKTGPLPGAFVAIIGFPMIAVLSIFNQKERPGLVVYCLGLTLLWIGLNFWAASSLQYDFLLDFRKWSSHDQFYYQAKLLDFLIVIVPAFLAAAALSTTHFSSRLVRGVQVAFICAGLIAVAKLTPYFGSLFSNSSDFYYDISEHGFSTVGFGIVFVLAAIASIFVSRAWGLVSLFLFFCFVLNRRTETVLILLLIAFYAWHLVRTKSTSKKTAAVRVASILAIPVAAAIFFKNTTNVQSWTSLATSIAIRADLYRLDEHVHPSLEPSRSASIGNESALAPARNTPAGPAILGSGLGWYALQGGAFYPHNYFFEAYLEIGPIGAAVFAAIVLIALFYPRPLTAENLFFLLSLAAFALVVVKAGELTVAARLCYLSLLVVIAGCRKQYQEHIGAQYSSTPSTL